MVVVSDVCAWLGLTVVVISDVYQVRSYCGGNQ